MGLEVGTAMLIAGGLGAGGAIYGADQNRKAINSAKDAQKDLAANLKYEPIDIEKLKADTTAQAISNATGSLALERQLSPSTAAMRASLPEQINKELGLGGRLSPDVANQVASQARVIGGGTGNFGGVGATTAALTGQTAQGLIDQRQQKAAGWLAANPLQQTGLDPGALASLEAQNNAAFNNFNLAKAGVNSNLINSQLQGNLANTAGTTSALNSLGSTLAMASMFGGGSKTPVGTGTTGLGANTADIFGTNNSGTLFNSTINPGSFTQGLSLIRKN